MSQYKPGVRLRSAVCTTEVIVIAAPAGDIAGEVVGALQAQVPSSSVPVADCPWAVNGGEDDCRPE